jgi:biopolymer transport protein ExbB
MAAWIVLIEWLARLILLLLCGLSVWSIAIIIERKKFYEALSNQDLNEDLYKWIREGAKAKVLEWSQKTEGLRAGTVRAALDRKSADQMEKAVASFLAQQRKDLERGLPILGTLGSTTPFVGLLGTIMGIIVAFGALSSGQMDSQKVMYALAEALILTAVGLAVAIPAVVAFNYFSRQLGALQRDCESLKDLMISYFSERS